MGASEDQGYGSLSAVPEVSACVRARSHPPGAGLRAGEPPSWARWFPGHPGLHFPAGLPLGCKALLAKSEVNASR